MNPKQFLIIGGGILVLIGVLGMVGVIGPTPDNSIFGAAWWFDNGENYAHLILGVVGLLAAMIFPAGLQRMLVLLLGVLGLVVGAYSLLYSTNLLGANLENPADTILHVVVGLWALLAAKKSSLM